jgi:hypothetical protein
MSDMELMTPKGVAVWPKLETPDTKFNPLGVYSVDLAIPAEEAEDLMKKLMAVHKEHTGKVPAKADNSMWKMEIDEETGEETGRVIFKCKIKNVMRKDGQLWDRKPVLWDAMGKRVEGLNIGSGSILRLKLSVYAWNAAGKKGISLQPRAVQVIDLKTFSGGGAGFDFEVEEGGFVAEEESNDGQAFNEDSIEEDDIPF